MSESLLKMSEGAKMDELFNLFEHIWINKFAKKIFYSFKTIRNHIASERARV